MKSTLIEETMDYDVFGKHKSNRKLSEADVIRLMESIQKKNMLRSRPILIDKDFQVIDGQHRLEAAKRLKINIPYYIAEECEIDDMLRLNANQKSWAISDYLHYYASKGGHEEYEKLLQFVDKEKIAVNIAIQLLNGSRSSDFYKKFKDGMYEFPSGSEYLEVMERKDKIAECIDYIKRKTSGPKSYLDRVTFYGALVEFFNIKSFSCDTFMNKLQYKVDYLRPCTRQCDYVKIFKDIYNWKNKSPVEIEDLTD